MDFSLIRTFIEVAATGSFVAASDRLYVTQSAVSLRIQRLEDQLGRPLFIRSKTGAELTQAGREFEGYAIALLRSWEEARQHVAIPDGFTGSLTIGAQVSLWPRLGFQWIDRLRLALPDLSIRAELSTPERMTRALTEGAMQVALTYAPTIRPGLTVHKLLDEELVLVAPWENPRIDDLAGRYVFLDWGTDFLAFHNQHLPGLSNPGLILDMGALGTRFIVDRDYAGYMPARYVKRNLDEGRVHLVHDAPTFPYPIWSVWRDDVTAGVATVAQKLLAEIAEIAAEDTSEVIGQI